MKGKTMSEKNNGWEKPEEKFPETEFEDSFAGFFSEEEEMDISVKEKKRRKNKSGPDILAVSEEADPGFVIEEVVALDTGSEIVNIKEETEEFLSGVEVKLLDSQGNIAIDVEGNKVENTVTDENGYYEFKEIPKGEYIVEFVVDGTKYEATKKLVGEDETINSNW